MDTNQKTRPANTQNRSPVKKRKKKTLLQKVLGGTKKRPATAQRSQSARQGSRPATRTGAEELARRREAAARQAQQIGRAHV